MYKTAAKGVSLRKKYRKNVPYKNGDDSREGHFLEVMLTIQVYQFHSLRAHIEQETVKYVESV